MIIILILLVLIIIASYLIDSKIGSSTYTYNSEVGIPTGNCKRVKLSGNEFVGKVLPFHLAAIGLPLIFYNVASGFALIILSVVLFLWKA